MGGWREGGSSTKRRTVSPLCGAAVHRTMTTTARGLTEFCMPKGPLTPTRLRRKLEATIQKFVVRTSVPPFVWVYAAYYRLCIWVAVALYRRVPEVVSIYLTGGLARGQVTYGQSDVDLMVFVHRGGADAIRARARALRYVFPILQAGELGVFVVEDLADLVSNHANHLCYRILDSATRPRLLQGAALEFPTRAQLGETAWAAAVLGRFEFTWNLLVTRVVHYPARSSENGRYLCAKLARQLAREFPTDDETIRPPEPPAAAVTAEELFHVGTATLGVLGRYCRRRSAIIDSGQPSMDLTNLGLTVGARTESSLATFLDFLLERYAPMLSGVLLAPSSVLPVTERELVLYLREAGRLELDDVRSILRAAEEAGLKDKVDLFLLTSDIALGLSLQNPSNAVRFPRAHAASFAYLASPDCALFGTPIGSTALHADLREQAALAEQDLHAFLDGISVPRITPLGFQEVLWQVLQFAAVRVFDTLPLTSAQVCRLWSTTPDMAWLSTLHQQYALDLDGRSSETERYIQRGIELMHTVR
jgi:hypothetical protein